MGLTETSQHCPCTGRGWGLTGAQQDWHGVFWNTHGVRWRLALGLGSRVVKCQEIVYLGF